MEFISGRNDRRRTGSTYLISVDKKCAVDFHPVLSLNQDCIHTDLTIELAQYLRTID
jgi:hypothetical protein